MERFADSILKEALGHESVKRVIDHLASGGNQIFCGTGAVVPLLIACAHEVLGGPILLAVPGKPEQVAADICFFSPDSAVHLPGEFSAQGLLSPCDEDVGERFKAAKAIESGHIVVAGPDGVFSGLPAVMPEPWPLIFEVGSEVDLEKTIKHLTDGGYRREFTVEGWGQFALRGGILDVFASNQERPVRIELAGDTVESIRDFNVVTQRSSGRLGRVEIFPAREIKQDSSEDSNQFKGMVFALEPDLIEASVAEIVVDQGERPENENVFRSWGEPIKIKTLESEPSFLERRPYVFFPGEQVREFHGNVDLAFRELRRQMQQGQRVLLVLSTSGQIQRAKEIWEERGGGAGLLIEKGALSKGFSIPQMGVSVYTTGDLLVRRERRRRTRKASSGVPISSHLELEKDSYVVHVDEGIGIYRGLVSKKVFGVTREYLLIEYAQGDKLYVPTFQLGRVQRYVGAENPRINRLRGKEWLRAKRRARRHAEKIARELLRLYMERKTKPGHAFPPDTPWERELEESFEYEETQDQKKAISEVKADMHSPSPMDRLICGDVGYGKTEVALRAAMKAVMDSKQVAVLVPTTVLASQHLETFRERLASFPVRVEMLSRFLSKREQDKVIKGIERGEVDVVIGTHRVLQDDVKFKDLGLLIIDEEHKFGVSHKEKLRFLMRGVDTLTLSATPIPRTLQMSLSGVRDISIIETPPEDRHPVATYVGEFDLELVKKAVRFEVSRGGQVFYVHNRIQTISRVEKMLKEALGGVSIAVAHGRMHEDDLELTMWEFSEGRYNLLLCTTIIESGLDLPNVNTLIVDRADRMGLAQLYQVRGRVGRGSRRAYAYFFYPKRSLLTGPAMERLATVAEMTALGSGMSVAMRDLGIRGAGNLLGHEQSGHVEAVGFELYCDLLREAVDVLKGERRGGARSSSVEIPLEAYLPGDYVPDEEVRVELYRRLSLSSDLEELADIEKELLDRFGEIPLEVEHLLLIEELRLRAEMAGIQSVMMVRGELEIRPFSGTEKMAETIAEEVASDPVLRVERVYHDRKSGSVFLKLEDRGKGVETRAMVASLLGAIERHAKDIVGTVGKKL